MHTDLPQACSRLELLRLKYQCPLSAVPIVPSLHPARTFHFENESSVLRSFQEPLKTPLPLNVTVVIKFLTAHNIVSPFVYHVSMYRCVNHRAPILTAAETCSHVI